MKLLRTFLLVLLVLFTGSFAKAQTEEKSFRANLHNEEFGVFFNIDLEKSELMVPGHEIYGPLAGYIGLPTNPFYWLVVDAEVKGKTATLQIVNDYGSEDLMATLEQTTDSTFTLTQGKGSLIKLPNKGKWMKLPKKMDFKVKR